MIRAVCLLLCLGPVAAWADLADVAAELAQAAGPGAAVAVWTEDGSEIAIAGLRHRGSKEAIQTSDPWHVGSLTKSMTATLASRLVEAGVISWDSTVDEVLGDGGAFGTVTLRALLTHRSGMAANLPLWRRMLQPDRADYVVQMLRSNPGGEQGDRLYSNAGYVVAGAMLEARGGCAWECLMQRELFEPLGLTGAGFGPPEPGPSGHRRDRPVAPGPAADNPPALGPAGRVHLPTEAMLRYLAAHVTRDEAYLRPESWDLLHGVADGHAMGWVRDGARLGHAGSNTLWFARVLMAPGWAGFVAVNSGDDAAEQATSAALRRLWHARVRATPAVPRP